MSLGFEITVYLTAAIAAGILGTIFARLKRRDAGFWMVACFLVPPLLAVLMLLPKRRLVAMRPPPSEESDDLDRF